MTSEIKRWGNSLALRIPKDVSQSLGLMEGSRVEVSLERGKLVIAPKKNKLEQLLKELEAAGRDPHGEMDWGKDKRRGLF
jgi:antitoxin MazE